MSDEKNSTQDQIEMGMQELGEKVQEKSREFAQKLPVLGHVAWLYSQLDSHKYFSMIDLESRVLPALTAEQCKLYLQSKAGGLPMAFVSWAYLDEEAEKKYLNTHRLAPHDWKSGSKLWLIDVIAPWGGQDQIFKEIHQELLKDQEVHLLMPSGDSSFSAVTIDELLRMKTDQTENKH